MHGSQSIAGAHPETAARPSVIDAPLAATLTSAIERSRDRLLKLQRPDGHWVGELQGDTILESEWMLLLAFLGREKDDRFGKAANYLLQQQTPEGGWSNYPGGPADISCSVKAYFALKIVGHSPDAPHMVRAREVIRSLGGAAACNSFTKFYLALLGQFPYAHCASVPVEMMLLPRWFYFNIYAMSSWTRTIVVPLSIFSACKPVRKLPEELGIRELFVEPPETPAWPCRPSAHWASWHNFFLGTDWLYKKFEAVGLAPFRKIALRRAAAWMLEHLQDSDGLGAIFPPMIYTVIALRCLGYADDSEEMRWSLKQLDDLIIEEGDTIRLQPCMSPVWDTALTLIALADAGTPADHSAITSGVRWLREREVRRRGDWSIANPTLEPAGWFFEYRNAFYPDTDDTAMVLMALSRNEVAQAKQQSAEYEAWIARQTSPAPGSDAAPAVRAIRWLLAMQNSDGGWAAFDRDINREVLTKVPFADHNAMLDPSCPDITARVLESLAHYGQRVGQPLVDWGIDFCRRTQEPHGGWPGRWGVNYIYGTWQVLQGLARVGLDANDPMMHRGVAWLKSVQQADGGWGETCRSYDDPTLAGQGTTTASQTAWALLGLIAAGQAESDAVRRGVGYLLQTQQPDGGWREDVFTGTGFPKVFYLKYHLYSLYFPLMALARYTQAHGKLSVGFGGH
jgi:squalene-hopene/tetraprenyl-beta-curcumene cyclase